VVALAHPLDLRRAQTPPAAATHRAAPPTPAAHSNRLAALAATVATIRDVPPPRAKGSAAAAKSAEAAKPKSQPAKAREASRHWVQIGIGEDADALPGEYSRLKAKGGKLLAGRAAWTAPMGETNRILVGPFPSKDDAQDFVNELAEKKLRAFAWTSAPGEKVAKLPAK
jgi:cell division septation protein DedD